MRRRASLLTASLGVLSAMACMPDARAETLPSKGTHGSVSKSRAPAVQKAPKKSSHRAKAISGEESVIVTGTHAVNRKARDSTSPVTVISAAELARSGQLNLTDALTRVYPAINIQTRGSDTGALTASIRMRGLNPNQVLVLVDGKRRHVTGNVVQNPGPQFGSTPVDLNMIPANAIDHIEVLEDGAAAMYGSDAIAGVVNVITKKQDHGLNMSAQTGANAYAGSGWNYQLNADGGMKLGRDGYLHLSGQIYHTDHFFTNTVDHRLLPYAPAGANLSGYYGILPGAIKVPYNSNKITSTPEETRANLGIDFGKKISETVDFYGLITYAHRHAEAIQNYRVPNIAPSLYPLGFSPIETIEENDYQANLGVKGSHLFGFDWDLSTLYGADEEDIITKNTANTGMLSAACQTTDRSKAYFSSQGCGYSPTSARAQTYRNAMWTNNLDIRRNFKIADTVPMTLAFGGQHRLEMYDIIAGEPPAYEAGGTQGYAGAAPQNAGSWSRNIWAAYIDDDFHPLPKLDIDLAGRFEHYTDSGNTENGKVSARYDFTKRIAVRATISNGFRAPTLAEQHYSALSVGPTSASGLLPVASEAARTLGASALKPERSTSASGGVVLEPLPSFHVEADVYQINLRDRIVQGGSVVGPQAITAIEQMGYTLPGGATLTNPTGFSAYYFSNGASTRTQGIDIKADYRLRLHRFGNLLLSMGLNINRTRLTHNGLSATGNPLLNAQTISYLTSESPRSKIVLNAYYTIGNWDVNLRQTRYGETVGMLTYQDWTPASAICPLNGKALRGSNTCFAQFKNTPRWLTDLEVGYRFGEHWHVAVGANNIFNIRPRKVPANLASYGVGIYDSASAQVPINGGYYFGRVNANF
ncbi:TonB-dependent receptor [Asaia spathodeae]|uniref:TonB-dependent receptor plug domain-containing protein n=1 Tax=Asaia spathodeae TaxID=657016 RepID=UPI002FC29B04